MSDALKRKAAEAAAVELVSGMVLGLGTGSTAKHFVDIVGERIKAGEHYTCVPTSEATQLQAEALGIPLLTLDAVSEIDLTVDGADALNADLVLVKGGGGALLREKMVAAASKRMIVIADHTKKVVRLGAFPLPVEIVQFSPLATTRQVMRAFAQNGVEVTPILRKTPAGTPYVTDNGNFILDCRTSAISDPQALAVLLQAIPGCVEHGLFIGLCSAAYLASEAGVEVLQRTP
jgi:ribose 5-phosphate isomerase A